jgi:hypothetical protein
LSLVTGRIGNVHYYFLWGLHARDALDNGLDCISRAGIISLSRFILEILTNMERRGSKIIARSERLRFYRLVRRLNLLETRGSCTLNLNSVNELGLEAIVYRARCVIHYCLLTSWVLTVRNCTVACFPESLLVVCSGFCSRGLWLLF